MRLIDDNALERFGQQLSNRLIKKTDVDTKVDELNSKLDNHTHSAEDMSFIGDMTLLETESKDTLVNAINEIQREAGGVGNAIDDYKQIINNFNNDKQLIADAVGTPLNANDELAEMANDINGLLATFKTNMMNNGITVESSDKFKQLIDKIATMVEEGSGKGIRYASEAINVLFKQDDALGGGAPFKLTLAELDFEPSIVFIETEDYDNNFIVISSTYHTDIDPGYLGVKTAPYAIINTTATSKQLYISMVLNGNKIDIDYRTSFSPLNYNLPITYYAIGVGEEDTTLRDSLADILENKGVDVTEEDDMASLITKVDERIADIDIKNIICGYCTSFLIKKDNSLWGCGFKSNIGTTSDMTTFAHLMDNVKQVAANGSNGDQHVMVLKNDGTLWACGDNSKGQLGLNNTTDKSTFTQVTTSINNDVKQVACGAFYTMILKNDGTLWATGKNSEGQLGLGNTTDKKVFTQVTTNINNDVKQLACTFNNTWVLKNDGSLWACGLNNYGQLGLDDTTNRTTFTQIITNVKQIYTGVGNSIFIIKNDGTLWACGYNYYGQLGVGTNTSDPGYISFTQVDIDANDIKCIACAHSVTVLLKNDGTLWGCGYSSKGELGNIYPSSSQHTFVKISQKSDNYKVCCGLDHVIVLKNDNTIWSSGNNYYGQLGLGYASTSENGRTFSCVGGSF